MSHKQKFIVFFILLLPLLLLMSCESNPPENEMTQETSYQLGRHKVECMSIANPEGLKAMDVFYPTATSTTSIGHCKNSKDASLQNTSLNNMPIVLLVHGYSGFKEHLAWLAHDLAEMGMVSAIITTSFHWNLVTTTPKKYIQAYHAGWKILKNQETFFGSPLYKKADVNSISLVGHSMGGGGVFYFMDAFKDLKPAAVISLAPYHDVTLLIDKYIAGSKTNANTLIISGTRDLTAPAHMAKSFYNKIPETVSKVYINLRDIDHADFLRINGFTRWYRIKPYVIDWLKMQVYKTDAKTLRFNSARLQQLKYEGDIYDYSINRIE